MILITGVAGFVGYNLAESFISAFSQNFYFKEGDICDNVFLNSPEKIEAVIHLAAKTVHPL